MRSDATSQGRRAWAGIAAHSESTPTRLWIIIPVMPIMAARPLLRSTFSLNFLTCAGARAGSELPLEALVVVPASRRERGVLDAL